MSRQDLDMRSSMQMVRRRKKLFGGVAVLGLLLGAAYAYLTAPAVSSTALVVVSGFPPPLTNQANTVGDAGAETSLATQIVIANSGPVLAAALPKVSPPASSPEALGNRISVAAVAGSDVLSITATGKTADQAENTANAVANSYIAYVTGSTNTAVHVAAKMVEPATTATGSKLPEHIGIYAILGALAGALVGFVSCVAIGRTNRRLVQRDAIANSIAVPVLASIPVERPSDPPSWARLLEEYEPDPVDAYWLGKLLRQFGVADGRHERVCRCLVPRLRPNRARPRPATRGLRLSSRDFDGPGGRAAAGYKRHRHAADRVRVWGPGDLGPREAVAPPGQGGRPGRPGSCGLHGGRGGDRRAGSPRSAYGPHERDGAGSLGRRGNRGGACPGRHGGCRRRPRHLRHPRGEPGCR